ncbi:MAG: hypothetical protein ACE5IQ_00665 [Candidatus Methylomirabilales bacterium]
MDPEFQDLDDLKMVHAFRDEADEMEFYQEHREWLLDLMEGDMLHVQRIRQFQGMILLWLGFKEGRLGRSWDSGERRWLYHPGQPAA